MNPGGRLAIGSVGGEMDGPYETACVLVVTFMRHSRKSSMFRNPFHVAPVALFALVALVVFALPAPRVVAQDAPASDPAAALVKKLKDEGDRAKPELIKDLANLKSRAALQGMFEVYDAMKTIFMKR